MADVHKDQQVYVEDPMPTIPEAKSNKGKKPTKFNAQTASIRVDKYIRRVGGLLGIIT